MQPETPPADPNAPYMQTMVTYTAIGVSTGGYGLLQWDRDGHIRLYDVNAETKQVTKAIFECLPAQIQKVRVSLSVMSIKVNNKTHNLDFSGSTLPWLAAGGAVGLYMANKGTKQSGVQWWADNIKAQGVPVTQLNMGKLTLIVIGVVFGLSFLFIMISMIVALAGQVSQ